jgi:hypothetical protein
MRNTGGRCRGGFRSGQGGPRDFFTILRMGRLAAFDARPIKLRSTLRLRSGQARRGRLSPHKPSARSLTDLSAQDCD